VCQWRRFAAGSSRRCPEGRHERDQGQRLPCSTVS
jgi:hypothetical protein